MTRTAEISIWDAGDRTVLVQAVTVQLPAEIGRAGSDGAGKITDANHAEIRFGSGLGTMSRQHMTIAPGADGGATVTDTSSNGVARIVPGQPPMHLGRNRHEDMPAGAMRQFETVGLIIEVALPRLSRIVGPPKLFAVYHSRSTGRDRALDLSDGCLALIEAGGSVQMEKRPSGRAAEAMANGDPDRTIAVLGRGDGDGTVILPGRDGAVTCNRRALRTGTAQPIEHLDTIEAGPVTLRIMAEGGGDALVCINPECGQMNAHEPGGNCRYCGTRLGDASTRMLPMGDEA